MAVTLFMPTDPRIGSTQSCLAGFNQEHEDPAIRVSRETTFVTDPRLTNGSVDLLGAWNVKAGNDVTHDVNGAIAFLKAVGPLAIKESARESKFAADLGWDNGETKYFVSAWQYADEISTEHREEYLVACDHASTRSWSRSEFPELAMWLDSQSDMLDELVTAFSQPRFFIPLFRLDPIDEPLRHTQLTNSDVYLHVAKSLCIRANLMAGLAQYDQAWDDILAVSQMARHLSGDAGIEMQLIAYYLERMTLPSRSTLLSKAVAMNEFYSRIQKDLESLPPLDTPASVVAFAERLYVIDSVIRISDQVGNVEYETTYVGIPEDAILTLREAEINWNDVLKRINLKWDDLVAVLHTDEALARRDELQRYVEDLETMTPHDISRFSDVFMERDQIEGGAEELASSMLIVQLISGMHALDHGYNKAICQHDTYLIAVAIERYRMTNGEYPTGIDELEPEFMNTVPIDVYSGDAYRYLSDEDGFVVYGVGENLQDEGGPSVVPGHVPILFDPIDDVGVIIKK